ncbi:MAG: extracellular solute-binding protein [Candidatus Limiplasma sp.]|nr:extracellular solute-binding protein [Candidatus Limiplasma sp.]
MKSKKVRILACLVLITILSSFLVTTSVASEPVTLTVMNWQFNEAGKGDQLRDLFKTYGEANGIQFEEISVPWGQYPDTAFTKWAAQDAPDIIFVPDAILPMAVDQDYLLPLSEVIDFEQYADILSPLSDNAKFDGKYYGFVSEAVVQELIYLPDLLEAAGLDPDKPPTTVDEFIQYALAVKNANPDWLGYGCRNSMDQSFGWWSDYCSWAYGFGARWAVEGKPTINSPENIAALTAYKKMYDSGAMTQGVTSANYRKAMSIGQCGFLTDNSSNIHNFLMENPTLNIRSAALPFPEKDSVTELVVLSVSKDAKHPQEAAEFIRWFMQPEVYTAWMEETACPTGAYKKSVSDEWAAQNPTVAAFIEGANYASTVIPEGLGVYMGEFRDAVLRAMEKVLLNNVSPEEALTEAQGEVEMLIQ